MAGTMMVTSLTDAVSHANLLVWKAVSTGEASHMQQQFSPVLWMMPFVVAAGCSYSPGIVGSGVAATEERDVGEFDTLVLIGSGDVTVTTGPVRPLTVETDDNLLKVISTQNSSGGQLSLSATQSISPRIGPTFTAQTPALRFVNITGSGSIDLSDIEVDHLTVVISGSGDIRVTGRADSMEITVTGSGNVDAGELFVRSAEVVITGSGSALVDAQEKLNVTVTGSGQVRYFGEPSTGINSLTVGSGTVTPEARPPGRSMRPDALPAEQETDAAIEGSATD